MMSSSELPEHVPFRVLNDSSYDRVLRKLENGSRWEWSFTTMKCEKDASGRCVCPRNMNVLSKTEPGRIIRIENGKQYPVYRAREAGPHIAALGGSLEAEFNVYLSRMVGDGRRRYLADVTSSLRTMCLPSTKVIKLAIHFDGEGMSGNVMRTNFPVTEVDRIHEVLLGVCDVTKGADCERKN